MGGWTDETRELFPYWRADLSVASTGNELAREWVPKITRRPDLDGRERIAIFSSRWSSGVGVVLHRQIGTEARRQVRATLMDQELQRVRSNLDPMLSLVGSAIAPDRRCGRRAGLPETARDRRAQRVGIEFDLSALKGAVHEQMVERLSYIFARKLVRCAPLDWSGDLALVTIR